MQFELWRKLFIWLTLTEICEKVLNVSTLISKRWNVFFQNICLSEHWFGARVELSAKNVGAK